MKSSLIENYHKKLTPLSHSVWTNPIHFIACGFGVGTFPFFPGTVATIAAIPLVVFLSRFSVATYLTVCILLFCIGVVLCHITNRDFGTDDHPAAVFDEIATFPVAMLLVPCTWYFLLLAFLLFRFFDIIKPGPIGWVDRHVHGGFGVMLDDLMAALCAFTILQAILFVTHCQSNLEMSPF